MKKIKIRTKDSNKSWICNKGFTFFDRYGETVEEGEARTIRFEGCKKTKTTKHNFDVYFILPSNFVISDKIPTCFRQEDLLEVVNY